MEIKTISCLGEDRAGSRLHDMGMDRVSEASDTAAEKQGKVLYSPRGIKSNVDNMKELVYSW